MQFPHHFDGDNSTITTLTGGGFGGCGCLCGEGCSCGCACGRTYLPTATHTLENEFPVPLPLSIESHHDGIESGCCSLKRLQNKTPTQDTFPKATPLPQDGGCCSSKPVPTHNKTSSNIEITCDDKNTLASFKKRILDLDEEETRFLLFDHFGCAPTHNSHTTNIAVPHNTISQTATTDAPWSEYRVTGKDLFYVEEVSDLRELGAALAALPTVKLRRVVNDLRAWRERDGCVPRDVWASCVAVHQKRPREKKNEERVCESVTVSVRKRERETENDSERQTDRQRAKPHAPPSSALSVASDSLSIAHSLSSSAVLPTHSSNNTSSAVAPHSVLTQEAEEQRMLSHTLRERLRGEGLSLSLNDDTQSSPHNALSQQQRFPSHNVLQILLATQRMCALDALLYVLAQQPRNASALSLLCAALLRHAQRVKPLLSCVAPHNALSQEEGEEEGEEQQERAKERACERERETHARSVRLTRCLFDALALRCEIERDCDCDRGTERGRDGVRAQGTERETEREATQVLRALRVCVSLVGAARVTHSLSPRDVHTLSLTLRRHARSAQIALHVCGAVRLLYGHTTPRTHTSASHQTRDTPHNHTQPQTTQSAHTTHALAMALFACLRMNEQDREIVIALSRALKCIAHCLQVPHALSCNVSLPPNALSQDESLVVFPAETLVRALRAQQSDAHCVRQLCGALWHMATTQENKRELCERGVCEALASALSSQRTLTTSSHNAAALGALCGAAWTLSLCGESAARFASLSLGDALCAVLRSHNAHAQVVDQASGALCALSLSLAHTHAHTLPDGCESALCAALETHWATREVAESVCGALWSVWERRDALCAGDVWPCEKSVLFERDVCAHTETSHNAPTQCTDDTSHTTHTTPCCSSTTPHNAHTQHSHTTPHALSVRACDTLFKVIRTHATHNEVVRESCGALRALCARVVCCHTARQTHSALSQCAALLHTHSESTETVRRVLALLSALLAPHTTHSHNIHTLTASHNALSQHTQIRVSAEEVEILVAAVLYALRAQLTSATVAAEAVLLLHSLGSAVTATAASQRSLTTPSCCSSHNAVTQHSTAPHTDTESHTPHSTLTQQMPTHTTQRALTQCSHATTTTAAAPHNAVAQEAAETLSLPSLCEALSVPACVSLCEALLAVLEIHKGEKDVVLHCLSVLQILGLRGLLLTDQELVVAVLRLADDVWFAYKHDARIQRLLASNLAALGESLLSQLPLTMYGICGTVCEALSIHSACEDCVEALCWLCAQLVRHHASARAQMCEEGVWSALLRVAQTHTQSERVCRHVCKALCVLCGECVTVCGTDSVVCGVLCDVWLSLLRAHLTQREVVRSVCVLLTHTVQCEWERVRRASLDRTASVVLSQHTQTMREVLCEALRVNCGRDVELCEDIKAALKGLTPSSCCVM